MTASPAAAQLTDPDQGDGLAEVQERVITAFETEERVRVFIELQSNEMAALSGDALLQTLGDRFELSHRYKTIPWMAGTLARDGLRTVREYPAVSRIQLDGTGTGGLAQAVPAVGVDKVQSIRGLSGKGVTVAVIDSGASTMHPALKDAIVAQHCFTQLACPPGLASEGESAEDDHNHGSNVTGIVASRGAGNIAKGYAPASNIVAVKVLNSNNAGQVSDWVAGFDWVADNLDKLKVNVINASLVSTAQYGTASQCDSSEGALAAVTKMLVDKGIPITVSSGNTGATATMGAPACNTGVFAVGATYDADLGSQPEGGTYRSLGGPNWPNCSDNPTNTKTIACFTCTAGARLDVLAPGTQITSTGKGTGSSMFRGTSQAAPGVAGLAALMLECNPTLKPAMILDILKKTGEPIMDPRTGMSYPLIRGMEAVEMACPMGGTPVGAAGSGGAVAPGAGAGGSTTPATGTAGTPGASGSGAGLPTTGSIPAAGSGAAPAAGSGAVVPAQPRAGTTAPTTAATGSAGRGIPSVGGAGQTGVLTQPTTAAPEAKSGCSCNALGASHPRNMTAWMGMGLLLGLVKLRRARRAS
ncbi:MAG TPA: S8 family serine peptidase [Polyangiales bacterium]|nr:S8 family serine peptidase [Polyangiales bacterium]